DFRLEINNFFRRARGVRNIERAAVGNGRGESGQLNRSHAEAVAVARHMSRFLLAYFRQEAIAFAGIVDASPLAETKVFGILHDALIAEAAAQNLKEDIV